MRWSYGRSKGRSRRFVRLGACRGGSDASDRTATMGTGGTSPKGWRYPAHRLYRTHARYPAQRRLVPLARPGGYPSIRLSSARMAGAADRARFRSRRRSDTGEGRPDGDSGRHAPRTATARWRGAAAARGAGRRHPGQRLADRGGATGDPALRRYACGRDRGRDRARSQHPADGALRVGRQSVHPVRGGRGSGGSPSSPIVPTCCPNIACG